MAAIPKTKEGIRKSAIQSVIKQLDQEGICYCQSYAGEQHDQKPPCSTVKRATAIVDGITHLLVTPAA